MVYIFVIPIYQQVYCGSKPSGTRSVTTVEDVSKIQIGHMVAVHCENYTREPVIGQCTQISASNIQVAWMKGSYSTSWKPWMVRDPSNRRKSIQWCDWIPVASILLFDFELTASKHLRKATIDHLKKEYEHFHQ